MVLGGILPLKDTGYTYPVSTDYNKRVEYTTYLPSNKSELLIKCNAVDEYTYNKHVTTFEQAMANISLDISGLDIEYDLNGAHGLTPTPTDQFTIRVRTISSWEDLLTLTTMFRFLLTNSLIEPTISDIVWTEFVDPSYSTPGSHIQWGKVSLDATTPFTASVGTDQMTMMFDLTSTAWAAWTQTDLERAFRNFILLKSNGEIDLSHINYSWVSYSLAGTDFSVIFNDYTTTEKYVSASKIMEHSSGGIYSPFELCVALFFELENI